MRRQHPSRSACLGLLLLGALLVASPVAQAQIVRQKPAQVKAANRRALREARATDSPYKDSHLDVTPDRLKRGQSTQPRPEGSADVNYQKGAAPNVKPATFLGFRRNKVSTVVRREQRQKPRSRAEKASPKK